MPEQLTKHPEVTIDVLRSAGARCGEGAPQEILKQCPPERFCKLPGGEMCVYGLPQAQQMTQVTRAEWQSVLGAVAPPPPPAPSSGVEVSMLSGVLGLVLGALATAAVLRKRGNRAR